MALNQKNILVALLFVMAVTISFGLSFKVSLQNSITPNAPTSQPSACEEQCPGEDGVLRNCTGEMAQSICNMSGRVEMCGGASFCCPTAGGAWTTNMASCPTCNAVAPTNLNVEKISPTSVKLKWTAGSGGIIRLWVSKNSNPTSDCGSGSTCIKNDEKLNSTTTEFLLDNLTPETTYYWRIMTWKESGCDAGPAAVSFVTDRATVCTSTTWTPNPNTVCVGTNLTQTSNCGTTREVAGTKSDGSCTVCASTTWTPNPNTVCVGTNLTQTSNCGTTREVAGTKTSTSWTPNPDTVCSGTDLTQTGECGDTRVTGGVKYCCTDATWSPSSENTCSESKLVQKSNCGNEREVDGTKTCYPNISVATGSYADDARNKPGIYFTDKKITKVSRDQFYVYTMEVYNTGEASIKDFVVSDTLTGQNQTLISFIDGESRCIYDSPIKKISCKIDKLGGKSEIKLRFRVKTVATSMNGKVIRNKVAVNYGTSTKSATVDTLVSSIVSCNEFCNNDSECAAGLACDVFSNSCRKPSCLKSSSCNCVLPTVTATVTATIKPTTITTSPTLSIVDFPDSSSQVSPSIKTTIAEFADEQDTLENLPSTGIFDLPETTIFGGGILLVILGIFFAL
jgi:hypothetical protein